MPNMETRASEISKRIMHVLNHEFPEETEGALFSAIENVLCGLLCGIPSDEHFGFASSFMHNVSIKLYEGKSGNG